MPLRDQFVICPRCNGGLAAERTGRPRQAARMMCGVCKAQLVPETEFVDDIASEQATALLRPRGFLDVANSETLAIEFLRKLPAGAVPDAPVACPLCSVAMSRHVL